MKMPAECDLVIEDSRWEAYAPLEPLVERAVLAALKVASIKEPVSVTVLLADDSRLQELNKAWRGQDKPTNVLSFPSNQKGFLGDLALAYETILKEAEDEEKSVSDHVTHLVIHGVLHCLGLDHESDDEAQAMEALEIQALASLNIANPYGLY